MSSWSIAESRAHVASRFGQEHLALVAPSLHALAARQEYARYHYQECVRCLEDFRGRYLTSQPLLVVRHGQDEVARGAFELLITHVGAHATACILSIHAIADVMAFATYQALGYNLQPGALLEREISVSSVQSCLRGTPDHMNIATLIDTLITDAGYKHVAALANKSKHHALVRPLVHEDCSGTRQERHEIRFSAFKHGSKVFPEVGLATLLEPTYNLASRVIVDVGNALNVALSKGAA